jgi:hypothetical protein
VIVRHFRRPQGKKARQTAKKAVQKDRRKEREEETGPGPGPGPGAGFRQQPTRLARPRVDACIGVRPSSREIRLEEGTNLSSLLGDPERGPWETDDVTQAEFRRLGGPAGRGGGQRAVTK